MHLIDYWFYSLDRVRAVMVLLFAVAYIPEMSSSYPSLKSKFSLVLSSWSYMEADGMTVLIFARLSPSTFGDSGPHCLLHPTAPFHPTSHNPRDLTFTRIRLDAGTRRQDQMYTDSSILYRVSQDTAVFTICDKRRHDSGPWRGSCLVGALSACFEDGETRRRSV